MRVPQIEVTFKMKMISSLWQKTWKKMLKLHKQFRHASVDRLHKLLACSGHNDEECTAILKDIIKNYEIWMRYSKPKQKPAIGLPMAATYNDTVAMELHELEPGVWYLHATDHFTCFSAGSIITTKKPREIVKHFIHWWTVIGALRHGLDWMAGGQRHWYGGHFLGCA